jgi:hypothetical protein
MTRARLLQEEVEILRGLTSGASMRCVCARKKAALVEGGFASIAAGALGITITGSAMLVVETTRSRWFSTIS